MKETNFIKEICDNPRIMVATMDHKVEVSYEKDGKVIKCDWLGSIETNGNTYAIVCAENYKDPFKQPVSHFGCSVLEVIDNDCFNERYVEVDEEYEQDILAYFMGSILTSGTKV